MSAAVESWLDRYARAFNDFDADALAGAFHCPSLLLGPAGVVCLDSEAAIRSNARALLAHHREQGFGRASARLLETSQPAPSLALTVVRWLVVDGSGAPLWDFRNTYHLADWSPGDGFKIVVSTSHADGS